MRLINFFNRHKFFTHLSLFLLSLQFFSPVLAATTSISSDTNGTNGSGVYTATTQNFPRVREASAGQIGLGTITVTAPAGFEFNTAAATVVRIECFGACAGNTAANNINGIADGSNTAITSITTSTITFTVTSKSNGGYRNRVSFRNLEIRPIAGSPLITGSTYTVGGTASLAGTTIQYNNDDFDSVLGAASASASTVNESPSSVPADNTTTSTITVTLTDLSGNPISGKTISLSETSGLGLATITTISAVTDVNGNASFTVKSGTAYTGTYTATDTTDTVVITDTATVTFSDITPPSVPTHTSPNDGVYVNGNTLTIDWSDVTDPSSPVSYYFQSSLSNTVNGTDNGFTTTVYTSGSLSSSDINAAGTPEGTYYWQVRACDSLANCSNWSNPWSFMADDTAPATDPSGFSSTPAINTPTTNTSVDVSWTTQGTDALSGVDGYSYEFTTNASDVPDNVKDLEETDTAIPTATLSNGSWYFHIRTVDNVGNWTSTAHFGPLLIDLAAPNVPTHNSPADTAIVNSGSLTIDWTDETDPSGPVTYVYQAAFSNAVSGVDNGFTTPIYTSGSLSNSDIDASGSGEATYYWQVRACDNLANCSNWSNPWELTVDNTAPGMSFSDDVSATATNNDAIVIDVTDANPDSSTYEYGFSVDNVCDGTDTFGNAFTSGGTFNITDESHNGEYLCARASDLAGNTSYLISTNVLTIDVTGPSVTNLIVNTDYNPYVRGNGFTIRADVSDTNGIDGTSCFYTLDNGSNWIAATFIVASSRCRITGVTATDGQVLTINIKVNDTFGNTGYGTAIIRTSDALPTSVSGLTTLPTYNNGVNLLSSGTPNLNATITDTNGTSPVTDCEYRYRITGSGGAGWSAWTTATWTSGTSQCDATISGLSDNTFYDFQMRGTDSVNHTGTASTIIKRLIDSTVPLIDAGTDKTVNALVNQDATVDSSIAGTATFAWTQESGPGTVTFGSASNEDTTLAADTDGTYTIRLTVTDNVGNSAYDEMQLIWDATAPNIPTHLSPADGAVKNSASLIIDWSDETDTNGPVTYVYQSSLSNAVSGGDNGFASPIYTSGSLSNSDIDASGSSENIYYWQVSACDSLGNCSNWSNPWQLIVDNTAPGMSFSDDVSAAATNNDAIVIDVTDANPDTATYEYGFSVDNVCDATDSFGNAFTSGGTFNITDESHNGEYICATAKDLAGNTSYLISTNVLNIDATGPTVTNLAVNVDYDPYVRGNGFTIRARVTDLNGIDTTSCMYTIDNGANWYPATYLTGPERCRITGVAATDGQSLTINIKVQDIFGNTGYGTAIVRTADSLPTIVTGLTTIPSYDNGTDVFTNANPDIEGFIKDTNDTSPVTGCQYRYRVTGSGAAGWSSWTTGTWDSGTGKCTGSLSGLTDGTYYDIRMRGIDSVNHRANGVTIVRLVDDLVPSVDAGTDKYVNATVSQDATASDTGSGIKTYAWTQESGPGTVTFSSSATEDTDLTADTEGVYVIRLTVTDNVGNVAYDEMTLVWDTTPAIITADFSSTLSYNSIIYLDFDIEDELSKVASATYEFIDSGSNTVLSGNIDDGYFGVGSYPCSVYSGTSDIYGNSNCVAPHESVDVSSLSSGYYDVRVCATDTAGNTGTGDSTTLPTGPSNFCYLITDPDPDKGGVYVDNTPPTANQLTDASFNEGDTFPTIKITGSDNYAIDEICITISGPTSPFLPSGSKLVCNDGGSNSIEETSYPWSVNTLIGLTGIIDTSYFYEGTYTLTYSVFDLSNNQSDSDDLSQGTQLYSVTYTINNVKPVVTFAANQTINEGSFATFTGSFTDPSYISGGNYAGADDKNWQVSINYGEGLGFQNLGSMSTPGDIVAALGSLSNYYQNNGTYTVTLKVCEQNPAVNPISEGECSTKALTVTVNNVVPSVTISADPGTTVTSPTIVTLFANVTGGNSPMYYIWGNDCSGTGSITTVPNTPGTYICSVTVVDTDGDFDTASVTIVIEASTTPTPTPTDEASVLGLTCDKKTPLTGVVYEDTNSNGKQDEGEKGIENIKLEVFTTIDGKKVVIGNVTTDKDGKWTLEVCPADYEIQIDKGTIPAGFELLGKDTQGISVSITDTDGNNIGFTIKKVEASFPFWILIVIILVILFLIWLFNKRKNDQENYGLPK